MNGDKVATAAACLRNERRVEVDGSVRGGVGFMVTAVVGICLLWICFCRFRFQCTMTDCPLDRIRFASVMCAFPGTPILRAPNPARSFAMAAEMSVHELGATLRMAAENNVFALPQGNLVGYGLKLRDRDTSGAVTCYAFIGFNWRKRRSFVPAYLSGSLARVTTAVAPKITKNM